MRNDFMMQPGKERKIYLDAIKILAMIFVVYSHSGIYTLYYTTSGGLRTWIYMIAATISKTGVPLFFMVSGALLLGKQESYFKLLKRVLKYICVIFFFESFSFFARQNSYPIVMVFFNIMADSVDWNAWYLYAYLGFLVCLPLLRKMIERFDDRDFIYVIFIHFLFSSVLPFFNMFLKNNPDWGGVYLLRREIRTKEILLSNIFQVPFMTVKAMFYPIIGYYLDKLIENKKIKGVYVMFIMLAALVITCGCTYYEGTRSEFSQIYIEMFDYVIAISIFLACKKMFACYLQSKKYFIICAVISRLGSLTLGMYFFDMILHPLFYKKWELYTGLSIAKYSVIWCAFNLCVGAIGTYILKKIPLIRRLF